MDNDHKLMLKAQGECRMQFQRCPKVFLFFKTLGLLPNRRELFSNFLGETESLILGRTFFALTVKREKEEIYPCECLA